MEPHARHLPTDQRRAATVKTVVDLAAEQNPSEITTSAIAGRMKLTQGALFRHFPSKQAIWHAVVDWVASRLMVRVERAAEASSTPLEALEAVFLTHVDFVAKHPGAPRMLFAELQRAGTTPAKRLAQALISRYAEYLRTYIELGKSQGEISEKVDTSAAATLFIGTIQGLVMQSLISGNIECIRTEAPGAFEIYRRGIRKGP